MVFGFYISPHILSYQFMPSISLTHFPVFSANMCFDLDKRRAAWSRPDGSGSPAFTEVRLNMQAAARVCEPVRLQQHHCWYVTTA